MNVFISHEKGIPRGLHARSQQADTAQDPLLRRVLLVGTQCHVEDIVEIRAARQLVDRAHVEPAEAQRVSDNDSHVHTGMNEQYDEVRS